MAWVWSVPVSYTHLDVYKRQHSAAARSKTPRLLELQWTFAHGEPVGSIFLGAGALVGLPVQLNAGVHAELLFYHEQWLPQARA